MATRDVYERSFDEANGKTISADACPECDGTLRTEGGETSCSACGLIVDEQRLDCGPEWRSFEDDETNGERTGAPLTPARHDRGLSTEIGYGGDAKGNPLSGAKRRQLTRLRREHTRAKWQSTAERNLAHACGEIARMTGALDLPKLVREDASLLYRRAQQKDLIRGRSIETIASGCVYAACRCAGHTRTLDEVAAVAKRDRHKVELGYRVVNVELELETGLLRPPSFIPQFASECEASDQVRHRARELAMLAEDAGLSNGRKPSGIAAACLYAAGRENSSPYTKAELARIAGVSETTIRERYDELREQLN